MASPTGSADPPQSSRKTHEGPGSHAGSPAKKIGKYEIQKKIGAGGMGAVYLALDPSLKRACALKVLPQDKAKNPTLVRRFKAEAQAAANLRHENIVTVFETGEADGVLYIALEFVEGTDVANLIEQRGPIPLKRSVEIVRQAARALEHASQQGIVHRDIKPGNLLVRRDGLVKLADLGLARSLDDHTDTSITRAGTTVGTVDYMSPEQARDSKAADVRSDIYSLGCTWYFMLTGEPPFPEGSLTNKLRAHAETPIPDPRSLNPAVSEAVFGVIRRMTEKKPAKRYQTPGELLADLAATSLNSDIVSDTIMSDLTEEADEAPAKRRKSKGARADGDSDGAAPIFKPPPRKDKDKDKAEQREKPVRSNAALFYGLIALIFVGVVAAIISVVKEYGASPDTAQADKMANPFANREAVENAAGRAPDAAKSTGTPTYAVTQGAGSNQTQKTTVAESADDSAPAAATSNAPIVDAGPQTTRISGENGTVKVETIGRGSGGGAEARPGSSQSAARAKQEAAFFPEWTSQSRSTEGLPTLVVQPGASGEGQFASLNQALEHVSADGALIKLAGSGPFPLYPVKIADKSRIVIQPLDPSQSGAAPLIALLPPDQGSASNFLEVSNTSIELRKVHLGLDASGFSTDPDDAMLSLVSSDLYVQGCSISVRGTPNSPMTALKISGKSPRADEKSGSPTRVFIENSIIRGNSLTALAINTENLDLAVRNSLIWSGIATAVRFGPMSRSDADAGRTVRLGSTTLCSLRSAVEIAGDAVQPVHTSLSLLNSLVAAPAGASAPALVNLEGWNQNQQKAALGKFINWTSTDSLYLGWSTLLALNPGGIASATTPGQWHSAWKEKGASDKNQFQAEAWPARPIADIAAANFDALAPQSVGKQFVKTSEGGWPGCQTEGLVVVSLDALDAVQTTAVRPQIPTGLFRFASRDVIRIDLTKDDLGKALDRKKPASGTEIVAFGHGNRQTSPIVIENAWVRLKFEQTEGAPLVLTPRSAESKHDALINVTNGGLEIEAGVFSMPASDKQAQKCCIKVVDGDLAMWRCRVQGPLTGASRNKALIQWTRSSGRPPARMFSGNYDGYLALVSCYLAGSGTLLEADLHHRALFFNNCVAASRNDALAIDLSQPDSQIGGVVDLYYSTLSAADRFFQIEGTDLGAPTNSPLAIYADRCVFAPPIRSGQQKPTPVIMSYAGPVLEQKQVTWWESHCGYSADITSFLRSDTDSPTAPQDFGQIWLSQWGPGQVIEPLLGIKGVVLKRDLPTKADDRAKLEPGDFELHPTSPALTWDGSKHPIGAYIANMKLPPIRGAPSSATKAKPTKTPAGNAPAPGF